MNVALNQAQIQLEIWCGLFSIICAIVLNVTKDRSRQQDAIMRIVVFNICVLIFDILGRVLYSVDDDILFVVKKFGYMAIFEMGYLMIVAIVDYTLEVITDCDEASFKIYRYISYTIAAIGTICLLITPFTGLYYYFDEYGMYHRNPGFFISIALGQIGSVLVLFIIQKYKKYIKRNTRFSIYGYILFPIIAMVVSLRYYGVSYINFATTVSVIIIFIVNVVDISSELVDKKDQLLELEKRQHEWEISAMRAQIQPHFLFNTLNTIKYLCKKDPAEAGIAIEKLSAFLRGSVDSLENGNNIYFESEIGIIENYIYLEKKRFGDRINVVYDLDDKDFEVPALSLQPLVENAVKHGICQKIEGGTVTISSRLSNEGYVITIADDGVGFDIHKPHNDGKTHVGLKNCIGRLENISHAKVSIESELNKGTTITIIIPKDEK